MNPPHDLPGTGAGTARFVTTHWSLVARATSLTASTEAALVDLCNTYWRPLYIFVRRRGFTPQEAEDLTQAFFAYFLAAGHLSRADPQRGRLRSYLVGCLENFLRNEWRRSRAQKRGNGQVCIALDGPIGEELLSAAGSESESPDVAYDRQWARSLLDRVFQRLRDEWLKEKGEALFEELQAHLWGDPTQRSYADLAARFGMTQVHMRVTVHRLRQRYRELLREAVAQTVANPEEVDDELRYLMQVMGQ